MNNFHRGPDAKGLLDYDCLTFFISPLDSASIFRELMILLHHLIKKIYRNYTTRIG